MKYSQTNMHAKKNGSADSVDHEGEQDLGLYPKLQRFPNKKTQDMIGCAYS